MNIKRINKLKNLLREEGIDGAVYGISGNIYYLLDDEGFTFQRTPEVGGNNSTSEDFFNNKTDAILYIPVDEEPILIATHEKLKSFNNTEIKKIGCFYDRFNRYIFEHISGDKIAIGMACKKHLKSIVMEIAPHIEIVDGEVFVESLRAIKDKKEITVLSELARFTDFAMEEVVKQIKEGMSQYEIGDLIAKIGKDHGATELAFFPNAVFTKTGHSTSQERGTYKKHWPLDKGTAIAFDFGYVMNGYCSDYGRSFYFGEASSRMKEAYKALQSAQVQLINTIKPGDKISSYLDILLNELGKFGYADNLFRHAENVPMGHQIGINVHEHPWINKDVEEVFKPGMVMCIEPKLWLPGECYIRVEDMVLITETGAESLTKFSRELFEI
jgi:Xaa-Pro aminopeptidase